MMNSMLGIIFATAVYGMKNGSPVTFSEFPYIVSIIKSHKYLCSGVIINENHVLTIGHVIITEYFMDIGIIPGSVLFNAARKPSHHVKEVFIHPDFQIRHIEPDNIYYDNDIALLRVHGSLCWHNRCGSAPLTNPEFNQNNHLDCLLVSWQVPSDRRKSVFLTWEFIKFMDNQVDQQSAQYLREYENYFTDMFGTAAIDEGDIGSPIVCGGFIRGIVVQVRQKTIQGTHSVFTSIVPFIGFIQEITQNGLFPVELVNYSYVVSIWNGDTYVCGGFIIDDTHVGTAGHCVAHGEALYYKVVIAFPKIPLQWLPIAHITIHPGYNMDFTYKSPMWYIDHDFGVLTLAGRISWYGGLVPVPLPMSDDLDEGCICEVLRWQCQKDELTGVDAIKLMSSRVVLVDEQTQMQLEPSSRSDVPSFWGRSQYVMPIAESTDVGNLILCAGRPVGFLVQAVPIHGELTARVAKFLKIRPYVEFSRTLLSYNK